MTTQHPWTNSYPVGVRWDAPQPVGPIHAVLEEPYPKMVRILGHTRLKTLVVGSLLDNDGAPLCHPFGDPMDTLAVLQYTGGTTGAPKSAMLTHAIMMAACRTFCETRRR